MGLFVCVSARPYVFVWLCDCECEGLVFGLMCLCWFCLLMVCWFEGVLVRGWCVSVALCGVFVCQWACGFMCLISFV